jgi:type II secretory pathway component PulK
LIVAMWILIVLAGMVLLFADSVRVDLHASANFSSQQQAAAIENAAVQYLLAHLDGLQGGVPNDSEMPSNGVRVGDGAFWLLRPDYEGGIAERYGVVDESSKLNVNFASLEMLTALPESFPEFAAGVIDWRDADSDLTVGGAESEYYLLLPSAYECKNAPLETVIELRMIKLMSEELMYGEDANRNGRLDPNENDGDQTDPPDDGDGLLDAGLLNLVTVYSMEPNATASGEERINVSRAPSTELEEALAGSVSQERVGGIVNLARLGRPFENIFDFYYRTNLTIEEFQEIADRITTENALMLRGRINVNTAPAQVLRCLPGLDESDVASLRSARGEGGDRTDVAWVAEALPQAKAIGIGSLITGRSYQFSADIVCIAGDGRAFRRCRVVIDARDSPPTVIYRRDMSPLGWPLDLTIVDDLRRGGSIEQVLSGAEQDVI